MYRIRQEDLPFRGSSHEFVGADHGDVKAAIGILARADRCLHDAVECHPLAHVDLAHVAPLLG
jgi:hypothetical protein